MGEVERGETREWRQVRCPARLICSAENVRPIQIRTGRGDEGLVCGTGTLEPEQQRYKQPRIGTTLCCLQSGLPSVLCWLTQYSPQKLRMTSKWLCCCRRWLSLSGTFDGPGRLATGVPAAFSSCTHLH